MELAFLGGLVYDDRFDWRDSWSRRQLAKGELREESGNITPPDKKIHPPASHPISIVSLKDKKNQIAKYYLKKTTKICHARQDPPRVLANSSDVSLRVKCIDLSTDRLIPKFGGQSLPTALHLVAFHVMWYSSIYTTPGWICMVLTI